MNNLPSIPAIGETLSYLDGQITRVTEVQFIAVRNGKRVWTSHPNIKLPTIAFMTCANRLRSANGLPPMKLPCGYCGLNERYSDKNIYCSLQCRQKAAGKAVTPKRGEPRPEQPVTAWQHAPTPTPRAADIPKRYIELTDGIAPDYARWYDEATALIERRKGQAS